MLDGGHVFYARPRTGVYGNLDTSLHQRELFMYCLSSVSTQIADVCLTRYQTLKCSFLFLIVGSTVGLLLLLLSIAVTLTGMLEKRSLFNDDKSNMFLISGIPVIALITTGVGLFEANALQFGLDQLIEAPTPKLIAFIHWYYWTHNVVQLVAMYITIGWTAIDTRLKPFSQYEARAIRDSLLFTVVVILGLAAVGSLVLLHKSKHHLYTLKVMPSNVVSSQLAMIM